MGPSPSRSWASMAALKTFEFLAVPGSVPIMDLKAVVTPMVHVVGSESSLGDWFWASTLLLSARGVYSRVSTLPEEWP
jgi:uncharacterized membrane protein